MKKQTLCTELTEKSKDFMHKIYMKKNRFHVQNLHD